MLELQLFADSKCQEALPLAGLPGGGETVLASSFTPLVTGFERAEMGKQWSEAQLASDGEMATGGAHPTRGDGRERCIVSRVDLECIGMRCVFGDLWLRRFSSRHV